MYLKKLITLVAVILLGSSLAWGADPQIVVQSNPDGAEVYLNGMMVCGSTPAMISVNKNMANKPMIFQFKKKGYESKTITLTYNKKELKSNPVVSCNLTRIVTQNPVEANDPTIRNGHAKERVSRDNAGNTDMERTIIRWAFDSDPRGARIFYRVISSCPAEVKNTNETYLTTTPYEETRGFNIQGLTYSNSRDVTIEIKMTKRGYEDQVKRFNVRQALDQQEISGFFELVPKDNEPATTTKTRKKRTQIETIEEEEE